MGSAEKRVARTIRRTKINQAIIASIAIAGIIAMGAVAPNLAHLFVKKKYARQRLYQTRKRLSLLIKEGYIFLEERNGQKFARLTDKGERFAALMHQGSLIPAKPKRWDEKWRLLIFDIPERRRGVRERIRITLATIGFIRLQDSVWAYPYDCEDFIILLKAEFKIGKDVLYIIADHVENDLPLRKHFKLTKS